MNKQNYNLLLADDEDDYAFFKDAIDELVFLVNLITVNDGVQLMNLLSNNPSVSFPDILFLDLNMPRKNGFECLTEIKEIDKLKHLPVIIFSTSLDLKIMDLMYKKGANYYIHKPDEFSKLKKVIANALTISTENNFKQPVRDSFILQP